MKSGTRKANGLADALAALEAGKLDDALACLLEAWAATPAPALAETLSRVAKEAARGRLPIGGAKDALQKNWMKVERDGSPVNVDRLLEAVMIGPLTPAEARLQRLLERPPDPRIGMWMAKCIEARAAGDRPRFWRLVFDNLLRAGDPRTLPIVEASEAQPHRTRVLPLLRERFPDGPPVLSRSNAATLAKIDERVVAVATKQTAAHAGSAKSEAGLVDAVLADWGDDGPKLVYADWLAERGGNDALRGELITLQCRRAAGVRSAGAAAREKKLLSDLVSLLGPVASVVKKSGLRFERGFLVAAEVSTYARRFDELIGQPAWATLRELRLPPHPSTGWADVIAHPVMRSLRLVERPSEQLLARLGECGRVLPIESILMQGIWDPSRAALAGKALPRLTHVVFESRQPPPRAVCAGELFRRLTRVDIGGDGPGVPSLGDWLALLDDLPLLPRFQYLGDNGAYRYELARGEGGRLSDLTITRLPSRFPGEDLEANLSAVAGRLTRLAVAKQLDPAARAIVERAAKRAKLAVADATPTPRAK